VAHHLWWVPYLKDIVFYGDRQRESAQKQLQENWRRQNAVIFVLKETITLGNEKILENSKKLFYYSD